jgi:MFS family permease
MPASRLTREAPADSAKPNPFGRLVTQGTFYDAGMQLSNGAVVLPVICAHHGITWAAGLLFPAFSIGSIVGNSMSPLILQRAAHRRHLLMAAVSAATAVLVLCDALASWASALVAAVFLVTSVASGVVTGVSNVTYTDMISSRLSALRRGELLLTQGAIGSALATGVALLIVPKLANGDEMAHHRDLLWLGAAGLAVSAIAALFVGPARSTSAATRTRLRDTYRQGIAVARSQPWFGRYALTCLLFAPICLGTTFYSLRAAQQRGSLHLLVILSSIGLVIGSALWRKVHRLFGVRGMLLGSGLLSTAAALLCILAESCGQWFHLWAYGTVFLLATVAAQAVDAAAILWISVLVAEQHRATLLGFAATLVAVESTALGAVLGGIAQLHDTTWPVFIVLILAVAAAFAALRAPARMGATARSSIVLAAKSRQVKPFRPVRAAAAAA